jgi:transposase
MTSVGVEIAKDFIDLASPMGQCRVKRTRAELTAAFSILPDDARLVMEATGRYHRLVAEVARRVGLSVRCVNPYVFSLYRRSVSPRAKNDRIDAQILQRFGEREWDRLPESETPNPQMQRLKDLMELRDTQVKLKVAWQQSMSEIGESLVASHAASEAIERSIAELDREIKQIVAGDPLYSLLLEMDGVGPQLAPALVWLFRAHRFQSADQVVAFIGMDVRVRESGKFFGQRKLTKRGPAFIRRLLYCAANAQRRVEDFKPYFAKHHSRGHLTKAVNMIAARKLVTVAYSLSKGMARYDRATYLGST